MTPEQCNFRVSKSDFLKLPQAEQSSLIYNCMMDLQEKIDWKWKRIMTIGAVSGFVGGFCNRFIVNLLGIKNI